MPLLIGEELVLLALRPDGSLAGQDLHLKHALGGALLTELVLDGHAALEGNVVVAVEGHPRPTHPVLAQALDAVATRRQHRPKAWVSRLARTARRDLLAGLVEAGILTEERHRILGILPRLRHPMADTADPAARDEPLGRLRAAVLDGAVPRPRTAALAGMVSAAGLDRAVFPDADRRAVRRRLKEIAEGDWATKAVRQAIAAVQAATIAAVTAANTAASSSGAG
jgi:hypothetical protein